MQTQYISLDEFCSNHNVEISFIGSLQQTGLVEIHTIKETGFIEVSQLRQVEKFIRFHYDLDINIEGIETITHLLQRITSMQDEMTMLRNRLRVYESVE